MKKISCTVLFAIAAACVSSGVEAQPGSRTDVTTMSLEELLKVEVVSVASRFPQDVREAPASITVVTAEDILRYGHRTLADVLRSVRGFYATYDRNYHYIGIRGFSRPGDYNTRVLLLVDGHRLNEPVYDMAPIGTDFPVPVSLIDRVEVIRGPASSLYGTNALLAVINVVTRSGAQHAGFRADTFAGSLGTRGGTFSYGRVFPTGDLLLSASALGIAGADELYFPEFAAATPSGGLASDLDDDASGKVFGSLSIGRFALRGAAVNRTKQVPTAAFGTVFGDDRLRTTDTRAYLSGNYERRSGSGWLLSAQGAYDYYGYTGVYPFDYGEAEPVLYRGVTDSQMITGDVTVSRRLGRNHHFTAGGEVRRHFQNDTVGRDAYETLTEIHRPMTIVGAYAQDEVRIFPWLLVNGGLRVDRYPDLGANVTPRGALVLLPRARTAVKLLHGRAFRAPTAYEQFYYPGTLQRGGLEPEQVHSTELVWEEQLSGRVRAALTAFTYQAEGIIEQRSTPTAGLDDIYYVNAGRVEGKGLEAEVEAKLPHGVNAQLAHSVTAVQDGVSAARFSNSPRHLSNFGLQVPVAEFHVSVQGQFVGERLTLRSQVIPSYLTANVTVTSPERRRLSLSFGLYNLFDASYFHPGAEEHLQQAIEQDGRTFLARARLRF
jgi:iron complex outermembrane receptor protein